MKRVRIGDIEAAARNVTLSSENHRKIPTATEARVTPEAKHALIVKFMGILWKLVGAKPSTKEMTKNWGHTHVSYAMTLITCGKTAHVEIQTTPNRQNGRMDGAHTKGSKNITTDEGGKEYQRFGKDSQDTTTKIETGSPVNATKPRTTVTLDIRRRLSVQSRKRRIQRPPKTRGRKEK